jgi:hypothetical protein
MGTFVCLDVLLRHALAVQWLVRVCLPGLFQSLGCMVIKTPMGLQLEKRKWS